MFLNFVGFFLGNYLFYLFGVFVMNNVGYFKGLIWYFWYLIDIVVIELNLG